MAGVPPAIHGYSSHVRPDSSMWGLPDEHHPPSLDEVGSCEAHEVHTGTQLTVTVIPRVPVRGVDTPFVESGAEGTHSPSVG